MICLQIHLGSREPSRVELPPGVFSIGRSEHNAIVIDDPSLQECHAEFRYAEGQLHVRNLAGQEATSVNGHPVHESFLRPGDVLKIGRAVITVELALANEEGRTSNRAPSANSAAASGSYLRNVAGAFAYPWKGEAMLVVGILSLLNGLASFLPSPVNLAGLLIGLAVGMYLLLLFREVVQATIKGEDAWPASPPIPADWSELRETALPIFVVWFFSFLPATLARVWPGAPEWLPSLLGGLAVIYLPMALLILIVTDDLALANPWSVAVSLLRAPAGYVPVLGLFAVIATAGFLFDWDTLLRSKPRVITASVHAATGFFQAYLAFVWARVLGLYYRFYEPRLGWYD